MGSGRWVGVEWGSGDAPLRENWVNMATAAPICTRYTNASHSRLFAENLQLSNKVYDRLTSWIGHKKS